MLDNDVLDMAHVTDFAEYCTHFFYKICTVVIINDEGIIPNTNKFHEKDPTILSILEQHFSFNSQF